MSKKHYMHQGSVSEPGQLIIGVRRAFTCRHRDAVELTTKMWIMILEAVLEARPFVAEVLLLDSCRGIGSAIVGREQEGEIHCQVLTQ